MPLLDAAVIADALTGLTGWRHEGQELVKEFAFADFVGSVMFVNRLTGGAEAMNHHPDLDIRWNRVTVRLSTHSQGGVTEKDLELASLADALA